MILVDTPLWIDHFRHDDPALSRSLNQRRVLASCASRTGAGRSTARHSACRGQPSTRPHRPQPDWNDACQPQSQAGGQWWTGRRDQNLTLNARTIDHFLRDQLDHDSLTGFRFEMMHRSDDDTGTLEKPRLWIAREGLVEAELGPVRELPAPEYDR